MPRVSFEDELQMTKTTKVHLLPLDENTTKMHWILYRNFSTNKFLDHAFRYFTVQTIREDQWMLSRVSDSSTSEKKNLTEFDRAIVQYRERVVEHLANNPNI